MSLMSPGPGGAALLGGMQMGMAMRKQRDQQKLTQDASLFQAERAHQRSQDAFESDVAHLVDRFSKALPGDEGLLSYEYSQAQAAHPDRVLPSMEALLAMTRRGGFGNRADPGKYFGGEQAMTENEVAGNLQNWIADVPVESLLDPQGYAQAEGQLREQAAKWGLNEKTLKPYVSALQSRRTIASLQVTQAQTATRQRQLYIDGEMRAIKNRVAMAFPAMSGNALFGGSPTSRMDPKHMPEFNAITGRANALLAEAWSQGVMLTAEDVIAQMRDEFRDVPQLQSALSNTLTSAAGMPFTAQPSNPAAPAARPLPAGVASPGVTRTAAPPPAAAPAGAAGWTKIGDGTQKSTGQPAVQIRNAAGETRIIPASEWADMQAGGGR